VTKSKKKGLGMNALFGQAAGDQTNVVPPPTSDIPPVLADQTAQDAPTQNGIQSEAASPPKLPQRPKIRNTFVIYEDTMKTLEMLRLLAERKKTDGKDTKVTFGDLIDEAVQALLEKKSQEENFQQRLQEALKITGNTVI